MIHLVRARDLHELRQASINEDNESKTSWMEDDNHEGIVDTALRRARYNETVHVTVNRDDEDHDNDPTTICLVPCLDRSTGGLRFENLMNHVDDSPSVTLTRRELQTKSRWFFPMLHDERRNTFYQRAISSACQKLSLIKKDNNSSEIDRTIRILDIGSGTGLLAMMAVDACQSLGVPCHVTSIEMSSGFAHLARRTIADNGMEKSIQVIEGHSTKISFQKEELFDLCVSELLEDGLLAEGWLPTIRDAWNRHLVADTAIVLPQRAKVYAQLAQLVLDDDDFGDIDDSILEKMHSAFTLPIHANKLIKDGILRLISDSVEIWEFSVCKPSDIPSPDGRSTQQTIIPNQNIGSTATATATFNGVLVWWQLEIDAENVYSLGLCENLSFQDHWHPVLHVFSNKTLTHAALSDTKGVSLKFFHNDSQIWINVMTNEYDKEAKSTHDTKRVKISQHGTFQHSIFSSERIFQLNDRKRLDAFRTGLSSALVNAKIEDTLVLDVSDFSSCATLAIELGARHVVSLESSTRTGAALAEVSGRKMAEACRAVNSQATLEILRCRAEQLTLDNLIMEGNKKDANSTVVVVAEPSYDQLEGWPIEEALNFYYIVRCLYGNGVISESSITFPFTCTIRGCIIESQQLKSAYSRVGDRIVNHNKVFGFDHTFVNQIGGNFSKFDLSVPIWLYDYKVLTEAFDLGFLDYSNAKKKHP